MFNFTSEKLSPFHIPQVNCSVYILKFSSQISPVDSQCRKKKCKTLDNKFSNTIYGLQTYLQYSIKYIFFKKLNS